MNIDPFASQLRLHVYYNLSNLDLNIFIYLYLLFSVNTD